MISRKNVSAREALRFCSKELCDLVLSKKVKSVDDVYELLDNNVKLRDIQIISNLRNIDRTIDFANRKGNIEEIYQVYDYSNESLEQIDSLNNGNILLLNNPTQELNSFKELDTISIEEIITDLNHVTCMGNNYALKRYMCIKKENVDKVVSSINMYRNQVERQALELRNNGNLFELYSEERKRLVEGNYNIIINYFVNNAKEMHWGELTDNEKSVYISSTIRNGSYTRLVKERLVNDISHYITFNEAKDLKEGNVKVLDRFIVKKK